LVQQQDATRCMADPRVKNLKFSHKWVRTWLRNVGLRRRRVATTEKILPSPEQVQRELQEIQERILDFDESEIISADETGVNYGIQPLNQYVPDSAQRSTAPPSDEKARITGMLWAKARANYSHDLGPRYLGALGVTPHVPRACHMHIAVLAPLSS
jgi:hypothetical protein